MKIEVVFKYSSKNPNANEEFRHNRGAYLIKTYNEKSKEIWKMSEDQVWNHNLKYFGNYSTKCKGNLCDRWVKEFMQIVDTQRNAIDSTVRIFGENYDFADL